MEQLGDNDVFIVEEIDSNDVPESELSQFQETEVVDYVDDAKEETELIQRFVRGEGELPELYTKLEPEDEEIIVPDQLEAIEKPSTSAQAAQKARSAVSDVELALGERQRFTRKRTLLNPALLGLMGEANLSLARGKTDIAEKICLEIIRQNPLASEPFLTLAEIYETRDKEKHLDFLTIAAHLNPHDRDQWIRISEVHIARGNLARARVYYSKAIKALYKDYDLRYRKARILEQMGEPLLAMLTYLKMITLMTAEQGELCLSTAKKVAAYFHENGKPNLALDAMEAAYRVCPQLFTEEDLNLYLDLLIFHKSYRKVVRCFWERTELEVQIECDNDIEVITFCKIPDNFLPDFRAKLCVSLIKMGEDHLLEYLIQNVHECMPPVEEYYNLYIDIAEALMQEHKYVEAIELLRPITDCEQLDKCPAFIWLRQADCLRQLNQPIEAIDSYKRVVSNAPYCYEAKFTLSALLKQQGRYKEAVQALDQAGDSEGQPLHARLLYERCMMLQHLNNVDAFLEAGCAFLGRRSVKLRSREELITVANGGSLYHLDGLKTILQMRNISKDELTAEDKAQLEFNLKSKTDITDLGIESEYDLFIELLRVGFKHRKFGIMERLCFAMITTRRFIDFHVDLERITILSCYLNDDCSTAFFYLREMISKNPTNHSLLNLLGLFTQKAQDLRYFRYLRRQIARNPVLKCMRIYLGHYSLHCSSYKAALNAYTNLFKEQETSILALCIAVAFNQLSMQKRILRRPAAVGQAVVFAEKYAELRRLECAESSNTANNTESNLLVEQEICYNIGRIYHQMGFSHLAVEYYERALRVQHPLIIKYEKYLGLQHEIAFNLHLIYRASGNLQKARQYLYEYCVV